MAVRVFTREEVAQRIVAITEALLMAAAANGGTNVEYCRGVLDSARAQALNYGIGWGSLIRSLNVSLSGDGRQDVLALVARALPGG